MTRLPISAIFSALLWAGTPVSRSATKRPARRPKVNPAGTKLARAIAEGRCGKRWPK